MEAPRWESVLPQSITEIVEQDLSRRDRKSTRLNSSHGYISYAVFCLKKKTKDQVYAQNAMLTYQQKEFTARVASIIENSNHCQHQHVSGIMRQLLTQAQMSWQQFTN